MATPTQLSNEIFMMIAKLYDIQVNLACKRIRQHGKLKICCWIKRIEHCWRIKELKYESVYWSKCRR